MYIPIVALSLILVSVLVGVAVPKLIGQAQMHDRMVHLGVSPGQTRLLGLAELAAVAGLLTGLFWSPLGVAAAIGLVVQMIGAVRFHVRAKDPLPVAVVPGVFAAAATVLAVLHVLNG